MCRFLCNLHFVMIAWKKLGAKGECVTIRKLHAERQSKFFGMIGKFFLKNGSVCPIGEQNELPQDAKSVVYEVLRVIDGIPVFLEEHQARLENSCAFAKSNLKYDTDNFSRYVRTLISANQIAEGNIACQLYYFDDHICDFYYFRPHSYPTETQYMEGVNVDLLNVERENPEAKIVQKSVRERADNFIKDHQLYEALMVDRENMVTEGSRSNVFFVKENTVFSAPENKILRGITFLHVLGLCQRLGLPVDSQGVKVPDLDSFQAAFISGTSPRILPIKRIGSLEYDNSNRVVKKLMDAYNKEMADYVTGIKQNLRR